MNSEFKPCIGIDLGTTYSCVGTFLNGKVEIISNENGERTTPSFVAFYDDDRYIGEQAKSQLAQNPKNTVYDVKRLIGRKYRDETVQKDINFMSYKIIEGQTGNPEIEVEYMNSIHYFQPEEVSAMLLKKLKENAESYLGTQVENAVITVPAYFNDSQRQATKDAGRIAGLNVLRIINEPTAAAIAYNINDKTSDNEDRNVLVYDLGGGTLDVTILTMGDGMLEVKSTSGDTHLGGEDFDIRLTHYVLNEFVKMNFSPKTILTLDESNHLMLEFCQISEDENIRSKNELTKLKFDVLKELIEKAEKINHINFRKFLVEIVKLKKYQKDIGMNTNLSSKLKETCEKAKKFLSSSESTTINSSSFYTDENGKVYNLSVKVTRNLFESICEPEFKRCMEPVMKALKDAKLKIENIHDVVLIGGSTRMPKIREILKETFGENKIRSNINPDEAVAYGATIQAMNLTNPNNPMSRNITLIDVIPLSLGVETAGKIMECLIPRNTPIPCEKTQIFSTHQDNQPGVTIKVYEGERTMVCDNYMLGSFDLEGIPLRPRNIPKIKVTFTVDENGILTVSAIDETSGRSNSIVIKDNKGRINENEIQRMISDSEKFSEHDQKIKESIESKINLETRILTIKRTTIDDLNFNEFIKDNDPKFSKIVVQKLNDLNDWLQEQSMRSKDECMEKLKDLEDLVKPMLEKFTQTKIK